MSGKAWGQCQDTYVKDVRAIPQVGGCFHNWAIHCTVSKRYQMERQHHDGCVGFRVVLAES